eukprot:TRINITY_DN12722_c0_g1_i2.p1 TRINITY_DN12722_c0_g1~~TRINITY_DN12722_c0_g1_i2.p1  ORF type:complete len:627 (+),score=141.18 TRINITY_DN12722_c0_g1_i2:61-1941(+)
MSIAKPPSEGELINMVNMLQSNLRKTMQTSDALNLPRIVVVGAQSAGKSSVLENIVGRDVLPRGSGIVTRCPLVIHMSHMSDTELAVRRDRDLPETAAACYATFADEDGEYTDFQAVRTRIKQKTDIACKARTVSRTPIELRVTATDCMDLTLVDLPGLTRVAVQGQAQGVEEDIEALALEWITPSNTIIVTVTAADTDLANSDALALAKRVDKSGERTIGVLTKVDLMDKGTDCTAILSGKVYKLQQPWIAVVNRGQRDLEGGVSQEKSLAAEERFFASAPAYSKFLGQVGTRRLRQVMYQALYSHIKMYLPELKQHLQKLLATCKKQLRELGEDGTEMEPVALLQQMLEKFTEALKLPLKGLQTGAPPRGAHIRHHFDTTFVATLEAMAPWDDIDNEAIKKQVITAKGLRTKLFHMYEEVFERFSRESILQLKQPAVDCVDYVHHELIKLAQDASSVLDRYPNLKDRVLDFMNAEYNRYREPVFEYIDSLIETERARINTCHPGFFKGGWGRELFVALQDVVQADDSVEDGAVVRRMVKEYFSIVRLNVQDTVPKAIMFLLVQKVMDESYVHLIKELLIPGEEHLNHLLLEHGDTLKRRKACLGVQACVRESLEMLQHIRELRV